MITAIVIIIVLLLVSGFLIYASASIQSGVYVKAFCRMPSDEKIIALTFDDGPDPVLTPQLLDVLAKYNVPAVFFCIGEKIPGNESLLREMTAKGHLIGNHTFSHSSRFPLFSVREMIDDIRRCESLISETTRQKELSLFRPPFGVTNPNIRNAVKQTGQDVMGWNIRSLDTVGKPSEKIIRRVIQRIKPRSIILFHDTTADIAKITEAVIVYALKNGYTFVRADKKSKK
jgi:peptidoglycan/xylan/chitin deacetylase (PgdA/CDA1 family)